MLLNVKTNRMQGFENLTDPYFIHNKTEGAKKGVKSYLKRTFGN